MAKQKPKKFLIDTSALPVATGASTTEHITAYKAIMEGGKAWTSVYIRKEFLRRFICDAIAMAITAAQSSSTSNALYLLTQDFGTRKLKTHTGMIAHLLRAGVTLSDDAKPIAEELASQAVNWLEHFDSQFEATIPNKCGCQIGGSRLDLDYSNLLLGLQKFYAEVTRDVKDCKVNAYLGVPKLSAEVRKVLADPKASKLDVSKNLAKILEAEKPWIVCKSCSTIGDLVISLEQPGSWSLLHIDKSFDALCPCLGKDHEKLSSMIASTGISLNPAKASLEERGQLEERA